MTTVNSERAGGVTCCPSCRLAISQNTGRLKWHLLAGSEESEWQQKKKRLMLITLVLVLLSMGILGAVSHVWTKNRSVPNTHSNESSVLNIHVNRLSYAPERTELEDRDRDVMQDLQTKFVPPLASYYMIRQKRSTTNADEVHTLETYEGNVTSDLIIWGMQDRNSNTCFEWWWTCYLSYYQQSIHIKIRKSVNFTRTQISSSKEKMSYPHSENIEKEFGEMGRTNTLSSTNQLPKDINQEYQMPMPYEPEHYNRVSANYPDDTSDEDYEMDDIHYSHEDTDKSVVYIDPVMVKGHNFPWKSTGEDVDDHHPSREKEEGEQESYGLGEDAWLALRDNGPGEKRDFHTFWNDKWDYHTIRHAQAKMMSSYMDVSADPCHDFYQYACGNWGIKNPIPGDNTAYDTFEILRENLDAVLKKLLEEQPTNKYHALSSEIWQNDAITKAKYLFQSCMNYGILEQRAEQPLLNLLDELGGWPMLQPDWDSSQFDWVLLMAQLRLYGNDVLISEWVGPDIKNSDEYIIQFDQTSLGLPTKDYFLKPSNLRYLEAYKNYLIKISTLLGAPLDDATQQAEDLINFETRLAKITSAPDERRNLSELYQRMSIRELRKLVPQIDWVRYLGLVLAHPVGMSEPVVVFALKYIQDLVTLLDKTPSRTVANYMLWRFVRHRANNLDDRFQEAKQQFYYSLFGREQAPSRWKNCVAEVNDHLDMALGAMFVRKYFDEKSKSDTIEMTEEIMQSFRELLSETDWIDGETKDLAAQKVDAMMLRIGYPNFILNPQLLNERYKDLVIRPYQYFENMLNILQHRTREEQDRLGTPVDKSQWDTAPAVVNAYYSRNKNQIMFPAGILQPPFYHRYFPRSLNYGGIGVVIGHEITHGFDDKGRLFDKDGNLHQWWHEGAIKEFHNRAQCLIDQYSHYTVKEVAMHIDGISTQGENIADNGGIKEAFRAYQRWLDENGDVNETLPGINATGYQLFFLNFAQIWCGIMRPEATRNKLQTGVHSPGKFRVIGTLSNSEDFASVFKCQLGTTMNPVKKCSVW